MNNVLSQIHPTAIVTCCNTCCREKLIVKFPYNVLFRPFARTEAITAIHFGNNIILISAFVDLLINFVLPM